ncbi:SUMF1/EgtB/PvdO family nonheme iron enzyme [Maribacter stanieri]|uniref:SUMF1/EgtB/PvdO family nonheme iron enzyme n=1 Tax=Maribacter stanieri TaxID=440514 RepID=UPI00249590A9|nr:SUMF1/EgtB/PvdO family nonheme iron enzyme [Maribacter stanieri]
MIDNQQYEVVHGPGLIFINENLFADETETTNVMWLEFIDWTEGIFGKNSIEFEQIQVDKSIWDNTEFSGKLGEKYFTQPDFAEYPIVGISLKQAELYSKWRTDRVAEILLISKGLIKSEFTYSKDNYFTIEKYINGDYDWIISKENILIPEYILPNKNEWELIAGLGSNHPNGIDSTLRENKKTMKIYNYLYNTAEFHSGTKTKNKKNRCGDATCEVNALGANIYGLYGILGNVSELTSNNGISKGGNWKSRFADNQIEKDLPFDSVNAWTGFRNIARQRLLKVK